jgi:protein phosphatase
MLANLLGQGCELWIADRPLARRGDELGARAAREAQIAVGEQRRAGASCDRTQIAEQHLLRNVLTNVLGAREDAEIHISERELAHDQMLLLCTDGVHGVLDDEVLYEIMTMQRDPEAIARAVVAAAFEQGSRDNATAIVVRYLETGSD